MKLKKLLLASVAMAALVPGAWAELPTDGDYLIQNAETGYYLGAGNSWDTQASLLSDQQWFYFTKISDGVYTLNSHQNNGGNTYLGTNLYCDSGTAQWTVTENVDGTFSISNTSGYLAGNGTGAAVTQVTDATDATKWNILNREGLISSMSSASSDNPVNVSGLIAGASIRKYSLSAYSSVWTVTGYDGTGTPSNYTYGVSSYSYSSVSESYHSTNGFNVNQTITGIPEGAYYLNAHAFYRNDGSTVVPVLYANNESVEFPLLTGTEGSMDAARSSFQSGSYPVGPVAVYISDGESLTVGVKGAAGNNWNIWGGFSLYYYGKELPGVEEKLSSLLTDAKAIGDISATAKSKLDSAIADAESTTDKTKAELTTIYFALSEAVNTAKASAEAYASIASYTEEITANVAKLDDAGQAYYNEHKTSVETKLSNKEYETYAEYESELKPIYIQAVKSQTSINSDWTGVIENADFKTIDLSAWNTNGLASPGLDTQNHDCEFFNTSFNLSQTISGMKKGTYEISLQAFQRLGTASSAADLMTAYKNDTWTSNAELYTTAQTSNVKNICEYAQTEQIYVTSGWQADASFTYDGATYYIPNSMAGTRLWFDKTDEKWCCLLHNDGKCCGY